eukprot:scaffold376_cov194-Skeletonema_dohrnii-CCMP3373.AAC.3
MLGVWDSSCACSFPKQIVTSTDAYVAQIRAYLRGVLSDKCVDSQHSNNQGIEPIGWIFHMMYSTYNAKSRGAVFKTTINDVLEYAPVGTSAVVFKSFCVIHCCPKIRGIVERCNATHIEVVLLERSHAPSGKCTSADRLFIKAEKMYEQQQKTEEELAKMRLEVAEIDAKLGEQSTRPSPIKVEEGGRTLYYTATMHQMNLLQRRNSTNT